jgi:hypothetical protein
VENVQLNKMGDVGGSSSQLSTARSAG